MTDICNTLLRQVRQMQNDIIICTVFHHSVCRKGSVDRVKELVLLHAVQGPGKSWKTYEPCFLCWMPFLTVLMFIRAPFYVLLVFIVCVVCLLVVLVKLSLLAKLLARKTPLSSESSPL